MRIVFDRWKFVFNAAGIIRNKNNSIKLSCWKAEPKRTKQKNGKGRKKNWNGKNTRLQSENPFSLNLCFTTFSFYLFHFFSCSYILWSYFSIRMGYTCPFKIYDFRANALAAQKKNERKKSEPTTRNITITTVLQCELFSHDLSLPFLFFLFNTK